MAAESFFHHASHQPIFEALYRRALARKESVALGVLPAAFIHSHFQSDDRFIQVDGGRLDVLDA